MFFYLSGNLLCQVNIGKPWTFECGASTNKLFKRTPSINLRYISPRFRWSADEWTAEEEEHPEEFKNTRLMMELIYTPPLEVLCIGFNAQSRLLNYRKFSLELYGGIKFFLLPGPEFAKILPFRSGRDVWYMNLGLLCQLQLGMIAPFADIGGDGILTVGTEVNFHAIYKKPKSRYKLRTREVKR